MSAPRYIPPTASAAPTGSKLGSILSLLAGLLYGVSPIDLIPDLIPLLGWSDDVVVLVIAVVYAIRLWRGRRAKAIQNR